MRRPRCRWVGLVIPVETVGRQASNSGAAEKTWANAKISIAPVTATNRVSDTHTMTVTVSKDVGAGWVAASGVPVTATKVSGVGNLTVATCTTDGTGQCAVKLFSGIPGTTVVSATATVRRMGLVIPVETDAKASTAGLPRRRGPMPRSRLRR